MKIKRIKWKEHPILGNIELDFTEDVVEFVGGHTKAGAYAAARGA